MFRPAGILLASCSWAMTRTPYLPQPDPRARSPLHRGEAREAALSDTVQTIFGKWRKFLL
jgi:hypothetical protein